MNEHTNHVNPERPIIFADLVLLDKARRHALRDRIAAQLGTPDAEQATDRLLAMCDAYLPA